MQGQLRFGAIAVVTVVAVVVRLGLGIGLVAAGWGVPGAVVASSASAGVAVLLALGLLAVPRDVWRRARPSLSSLRGGFASALLGIGAFWLLAETDLVLARHFLNETDAGSYAAAGLLCRALLFLPAAVCWVALPRFSESRGRGEAARRWLRGAIGMTAALSTVAFLLMVALRGLLVDIAFGSEFRPAAELIPLLGLAMGLLSIVNLLVFFHVAAETRTWLFLLAGCVAEIVLVSFFHDSPEQIALVVVGVAAGVTVLQAYAASAVLRWSPGPSRARLVRGDGWADAERRRAALGRDPVLQRRRGPRPGGRAPCWGPRRGRDRRSSWSRTAAPTTPLWSRTAPGSEGLRVLHYPDRMGKGHALRVGLNEARGRYVAFMDGDGDIDPEGLRPFLTLMELYDPDIVLGSKRHPLSEVTYPPIRRAMSWTYHKLTTGAVQGERAGHADGTEVDPARCARCGASADVREAIRVRPRVPRGGEAAWDTRGSSRLRSGSTTASRVMSTCERPYASFSTRWRSSTDGTCLTPTGERRTTRSDLGTARRRSDPVAPLKRRGTRWAPSAILFLNWRDITNPEAGGAEVFTHEVAKRWVEQGHEVSLLDVAVPRQRQTRRRSTASRSAGCGRLRSGSFHILAQQKLARLSGFDVVIDEVNTIPFLTPLWRRRLPPVVTLIHQLAVDVWDSEVPRPLAAIGRSLEPRLLGLYKDAPVVTVSESTRDDLRRLGLRNVSVIPMGRTIRPT